MTAATGKARSLTVDNRVRRTISDDDQPTTLVHFKWHNQVISSLHLHVFRAAFGDVLCRYSLAVLLYCVFIVHVLVVVVFVQVLLLLLFFGRHRQSF